VEGLGHARLRRALADLRADAVVHAVGDDRPAVVHASADDVQLVAALRAVLVGPQRTGARMQGRALDVAIAEREDLGPRAGALRERVVGGHAPVVVQAQDLAGVVVEALRAVLLAAVAERHEEVTLAVEYQFRAEMAPAARFRLHSEDRLHLDEAIPREPRARNFGADARAVACRVREIDPAVLGESRVERDVEQSALAVFGDVWRQALQRPRLELAVVPDDAQASGPLGDEHPAIRQERDAPRVRQAGHDHHCAQLVQLGADRLRASRAGEREKEGGERRAQAQVSGFRPHRYSRCSS
jgi:hypothetical protein